MQINTLEQLFSYPNFLFIFLAILATIANIIIGVSILPKDKRKKGYNLHRYMFWVVMVFYALFLVFNHYLLKNNFYEYFVGVYFLLVVYWSRKINVTLHAIISSLGLVMLGLIATFGLL